MRRCDLFRALSREHRRVIREAGRLCRALERPTSSRRAVDAFLAMWATEMVPHQRKEEEVLIPELSARVAECDPLVVLTVVDHVVLRRLVREMGAAPAEQMASLAARVARKVAEHAQFEEHTLFPALAATLGPTRLQQLDRELCAHTPGESQAVRGAQGANP